MNSISVQFLLLCTIRPSSGKNKLSVCLSIYLWLYLVNHLMTYQCKWIVDTAVDELSTSTNHRAVNCVISHTTTDVIATFQYNNLCPNNRHYTNPLFHSS